MRRTEDDKIIEQRHLPVVSNSMGKIMKASINFLEIFLGIRLATPLALSAFLVQGIRLCKTVFCQKIRPLCQLGKVNSIYYDIGLNKLKGPANVGT